MYTCKYIYIHMGVCARICICMYIYMADFTHLWRASMPSTATYCNTLQHQTSRTCGEQALFSLHHTLQHTATRCSTRCNTHRNTHYRRASIIFVVLHLSCNKLFYLSAAHYITLHHAATHYNTLQHTLKHTAAHCNTHLRQKSFWLCRTLQHTATHCNTPQHAAMH